MSCSCIKRHLKLEYDSKIHEKPGGFNNYTQLIQFIYTTFPELRCYPLTLYLDSSPISPQQYHSLFMHNKILEITIKKQLPEHLTPYAIFKLRLNESDVIGTGFLFTYTHGFISSDFCSPKIFSELRVLFEDGSEFGLKEGTEAVDLGSNISLIELSEKFMNFQPVIIDLDKHLSNVHTFVYFFLKSLPQLEKKPIEILNFSSVDNTIETEEGMIGAPILSSDNKLVGIVNSINTVVPIQDIIKNLPESITLPSCYEFNIERPLADFYPTTCFINHSNQTAGYYSADEALNKTFQIYPMLPGSSATSTLYGIVFIGVNLEMDSISLLYNGKKIEILPSPLSKHLYHASIYHNELLYIIGGSSSVVEYFNFRENLWKHIEGLSKRRSFATAAACGRYIYVVGGKRNERYLKSILRLKKEKWTKLGIFLPVHLASCGVIQRKSDLLVFGGFKSGDAENEESWKISLSEGTVENEKFSVRNGFGRFNPLVVGDEALVYSNTCEMIKYDFDDNELFRLILDDETLNLDE